MTARAIILRRRFERRALRARLDPMWLTYEPLIRRHNERLFGYLGRDTLNWVCEWQWQHRHIKRSPRMEKLYPWTLPLPHELRLAAQKSERAQRRRGRRLRKRAALGCLLRLVATARRPGRAKLLSPWARWLRLQSGRKWFAKWADARAAEALRQQHTHRTEVQP